MKANDHAAYRPPKWGIAQAAAVQALVEGTAEAHQQQAILRWLIEECCKTYDLSFRPGPQGARETDFAEGRRFVGLMLVQLTHADLSRLKRDANAD